ncbi:MAG: response regulator [Gammaproteobacteria bacterium]|nr:response regulator [Gammaproteobacteria bacterium]
MKQSSSIQSQKSDQAMESRVQLEEIRMLYGSLPFSMLAALAVSLIIYLVMLDNTKSPEHLSFWFTVMLGSIVLRSWDSYAFTSTAPEEQSKKSWGLRFLLGSTFSGFWWGMLSWLGQSTENEYQTLIVVCIVGVAGGSLITLSYRWQTIVLFLMPALVLLELHLIIEDNEFFDVLSYLIAVFILFTVSASRRVYKNSNQNIRLRIEADIREDALRKAKNEAEHANEAKSIFLSNMSHELRTPLNAILGYTQLLRHDGSISSKQQDNIKEIDDAGKLLLELVNQVLDLSSIEEGNLRISIESLPLETVLQECKSLIQPMADENNIRLDFITDCVEYVKADHTRLKQVILNLLSNAIKYSHRNGMVTVRCHYAAENRIHIIVEDNGFGIPQDKLQSLFEPFTRLETNPRKVEGTGIGLAISKKLTEMTNGILNVQSEIGRGSTFWIELESSQNNDISDKSQGQHDLFAKFDTRETTNAKVLIVEDNPSNLKLISNQLRTLGYKADLASNGKEGLNMLRSNDYALVLTDCNMPIMDGYELAIEIRKENSQIPVIALTADAFPEREQECLSAGMNDRIVKPVNLQNLENTLQKWIQ